jgi:hypothetical protein
MKQAKENERNQKRKIYKALYAICFFFLSRGDLIQASEKLWGASATAVKSVAAKRGLKLEQHGGLWVFINMLTKESGDENIVRFFNAANTLHKNF